MKESPSKKSGPSRTLLLLRHAKSDWSTNRPDHDRPLGSRGRKASRTMGRFLARSGLKPDAVVSSSARRTLETIERVLNAADLSDLPVRSERGLYESSPQRSLEIIQQVSPSAGTLLVVGHEPCWSSLAGRLIGRADLRFPTAALAVIRFTTASWEEVRPGVGQLLYLVTPKLLQRLG